MKQEIDDELMFNFVQVSIDCNSDLYFRTISNKPIGIHTGMIISELSEEKYKLGKTPLSSLDLEQNMKLFAQAFRDNIDFDNPKTAQQQILTIYNGTDEVTKYNRERILMF